MNLNQLTIYGKEYLEGAGIEDALLESRLLLSYIVDEDRSFLYSHPDYDPGPECERIFLECLEKRASHVPLQHITGTQEFMGLAFSVDTSVLIPRPDTEILVEEALKELHDGMEILDLCTGSGCIILSLLHYSNDCRGVAVDISERAIHKAGENALNLGITNISFIQGDIMDGGLELPADTFDLICSNPPYIPTGDIKDLMPEVRDHDPVLALDGGEDGLVFYRCIAERARNLLKTGGHLFLEIGYDQAEQVEAILKDQGYRYIETIKDYSGHDRVMRCVR